MVPVLMVRASKVPDTEALPSTSNLVVGEVVPIPTLPLVVTLKVPLATFNPLAISRLPAKEEEPVPENMPSPVTKRSSPTSKSRDTEALEPNMVNPDIEAVPPTSRVVLRVPPELMPRLVPK